MTIKKIAVLFKKMTQPTALCSYCNAVSSDTPMMTWRQVGKEPLLSDWFSDIDDRDR